MNKKGLTLIELLTVIVILSILMVILFPTVKSLLGSSKSKVKSADEKSVREAAEMYVADHVTNFSTNGENYLTIQTLIDGGYLEIDVDKYDIPASNVHVIVRDASSTAPENKIFDYSVTLKNK